MILKLVNVDDNMARSVVCASPLKNGAFAQVKGLANEAKAGVALNGEAFEVEALTDDAAKMFVIIAPDVPAANRYKDEYRYNMADYDDVKAHEVTRAYILHRGDRVQVEKELVEGSPAAGAKLAVKAGEFVLKAAAGTEKAIVAMVLGTCKLAGRDAYDILFL